MAFEDDTLQAAATSLRAKLGTFGETLTPEEKHLLSLTLRAAATSTGHRPDEAEVEGYAGGFYFFVYVA